MKQHKNRGIMGLILACFCMALGAQNYSPQAIQEIQAGYENRRSEAFELLRGKKLVREKIIPPIFSDGSDFSRHYSYSLMDYAFKCLWLGEDIKGANAALLENANYYIGYPRAYKDKDSFYWATDEMCKMLEFYGRNGSIKAGLIKKEVEERIYLMMWQYTKMQSKVAKASYEGNQTWHVDESENHHVQRFYAAWHFAKYLMNHPTYKEQKMDDGYTAAEHYVAWNSYIKEWIRERGRKGLFIEMGNDSYGLETLKGVYNLYEFGDAEMRSLSKNLIDLYWAAWAQEQMESVRGGSKSRVYPYEGAKGKTPFRKMAWYYLGTNEINAPYNNLFTLITSEYRMPQVVMDIALNRDKAANYEISQRRLGQAEDGFFTPPNYHVLQDRGLIRYAYCTPNYIAGSFMCEALPYEKWALISSQNRWAGVVFSGHEDARIYAHVKTGRDNRGYNQFWGVQHKGAMIYQKLDSVVCSRGAQEMRMWISKAGITNRLERDEWVFVETEGAYAAITCVGSSYRWEEQERGSWMVGEDFYAPFVLQVAEKGDYSSYQAFQEKVLSQRCKIENNRVYYTSVTGDVLSLPLNAKNLPTVNGCAVDLKPSIGMNSPFVQTEFNSGVVKIMKDDQELVLDFN